MPIKGKIIAVGAMFNGTRKSDGQPWKKQEYVLETAGQYPKKVAFNVMNDKIDKAALQVGHSVEIDVDASSREYNGRWYTELTAWRINNMGVVNNVEQRPVYEQQAPEGYSAAQTQPTPTPNTNDSFPF